ncbi:hypothetical protein QWZ13_09510 [Reinekea marina]|nr:hypothetical protein [Reinekea marina]MDN3649146.1 hypothetical protein [Reinekea marina]
MARKSAAVMPIRSALIVRPRQHNFGIVIVISKANIVFFLKVVNGLVG